MRGFVGVRIFLNKSIYFIFLYSNNFQQSSHGIESPNMQWETARCEDNLRIYNNTHGYGSQVKIQSKNQSKQIHRVYQGPKSFSSLNECISI